MHHELYAFTSARVPKGHRSTAARAFQREGIPVKLRPSRQKPQRGPETKAERKIICGRLRLQPLTYFTDDLDLIMDNKKWEAATIPHARDYLLNPGFTKPNG